MAYLVKSLVNLRAEIDARWPNRDRRTDGWYRAPRDGFSVGHNPDSKGAVHAIDVDRDGLDPGYIIAHARRAGGVLFYIIWDRRFWSASYNWVPQSYNGRNPHTDHLHIEVYQTVAAESYGGEWGLAGGIGSAIGGAALQLVGYEGGDPLSAMMSAARWMRDTGMTAGGNADRVRGLYNL